MSALEDELYSAVVDAIPGEPVLRNKRPSWLAVNAASVCLELDIYLPGRAIAFEVQGAQHYVFSPFFHGNHEGFRAQLDRDAAKRAICASAGVRLIEVSCRHDITGAIDLLRQMPPLPPAIFGITLPNEFIAWMDGAWLLPDDDHLAAQEEAHFSRIRAAIDNAVDSLAGIGWPSDPCRWGEIRKPVRCRVRAYYDWRRRTYGESPPRFVVPVADIL